MNKKPVVLFLCTGNACRSQMAEAILRHRAGDRFDVHSAGLSPQTGVHPMALRVLDDIGVESGGLHPKGTDKYLGRLAINYAIIVCEKAQHHCPRIYPFSLKTLYWPFPDPAMFEGTEQERLERFREVRDQIDQRIEEWLEASVQS